MADCQLEGVEHETLQWLLEPGACELPPSNGANGTLKFYRFAGFNGWSEWY
jgi:hypothetical protein